MQYFHITGERGQIQPPEDSVWKHFLVITLGGVAPGIEQVEVGLLLNLQQSTGHPPTPPQQQIIWPKCQECYGLENALMWMFKGLCKVIFHSYLYVHIYI